MKITRTWETIALIILYRLLIWIYYWIELIDATLGIVSFTFYKSKLAFTVLDIINKEDLGIEKISFNKKKG